MPPVPDHASPLDSHPKRLARLDSSAVSDALDKLGLSGVADGIEQVSSDRRIAGPVVTVRLEAGSGSTGAARHLGASAIEAAKSGDIIVVQHPGGEAAGWGGILSLGAKLRSVAGAIVGGPVRDIDDSRALDFPVFATAVTPRTARGRIVEAACNEPITIAGVPVAPGDFVIADGSGVVFVKAGEIDRVLDTAEALARREREMTTALLEGTAVGDVMNADYEQLLKRS
jgi:4-hydroxy-4-methyl-2-oxoglutarate aldolase